MKLHDRIRIGIGRCHIENVQEETGAAQMLQKAGAKTSPLGGTRYEARNVGDDEGCLEGQTHDAQVRA
jgi:hypothetical protein